MALETPTTNQFAESVDTRQKALSVNLDPRRYGTFAEIGELQVTLSCGRLPVSPGDWIVGDNSGLVVVPQSMLAEVAREAEKIHTKELRMAEALNQGKTLSEAAKSATSPEN